MIKPIAIPVIVLTLVLSACTASGSASGGAAYSAELTGTYDCFGLDLDGGAAAPIAALTLNPDGTGAFGSSAIQWSYDPNANLVTFTGDADLQDAVYFPDGPTLSVNVSAAGSVEHAPDGHFTCVKS